MTTSIQEKDTLRGASKNDGAEPEVFILPQFRKNVLVST
jgi:hypothetical protein